ncbi:M48 family metallopeptidase [Ideonella sp. A 288]|uniref:M48 metallopeptidase family protein n=1 Tax=Ideonella sp. A 288 TaxID=1962181 RepID=UPI001F1BF689|nr:YgjP-like metallopeptidase domain-containing protein [Ideonella sp. A 288]
MSQGATVPAPAVAPALPYLSGYAPELLEQVRGLIAQGRLGEVLRQRHPDRHEVRTDRQLYDHVAALKTRYLRNAAPLSRVLYDSSQLARPDALLQTLGTHTTVSRVQGGKLKAKREIRIASVFKDAPAAFLQMIVVHELAHLKEREHDRAFYALCTHMEPDYHQLEFDVRLWLTAMALERAGREAAPGVSPDAPVATP